MEKNHGYWNDGKEAFKTSIEGLKLTFRHFKNALLNPTKQATGPEDEFYFRQPDGVTTLRYPHESIPVPDNGRYKLHNEIEDCIVCDKCVKICPVNCIVIEPIKSAEVIGYTSDGSAKRLHAAKFDIDMAKCCNCGLCTTVCPTECLTMTKEYDYSTFDVRDMNLAFSEMTAEEAVDKQRLYDEAQAAKKAAKLSAEPSVKEAPAEAAPAPETKPADAPAAKPKFKPKAPAAKKPDDGEAPPEK